MRVDLRGMLLNAISAGRPRRAYYTFSINELLENLKELRQRHQAGDGDAALTEFFELYVVTDERASPSQTAERASDVCSHNATSAGPD